MLLLIDQLLTLYSWIILARVALSWLVKDPRNPIYQAVGVVTEPVLAPLRKLVPPEKLGGLDISPIFAFVAINVLRRLLWAGAL